MLNIDTALPSDSARDVQVDTSTPQPQGDTFSLALEAEYQKEPVSAESETAALPSLDEDLKHVPLSDTSALKRAPEKQEAGESEEDSSLSVLSFFGWTPLLWQNLPGSAGEQLPGKATAGSRIPEKATPPDDVVAAANPPMANASLLIDPTVGETPGATVNADDPIGPVSTGDVPPQQQVLLVANEKTMPEIVSKTVEHASSTSQPDKVVDDQSGSTEAVPFDIPDYKLRLEATVSIVYAADNLKPGGSKQPEVSLQKETDSAEPTPVPLAGVETAASNGDVKEQSKESKHNNPEINISHHLAEPEEEQRAVHVMHEPVPETQLPSDLRGPASSHDTGGTLPAGSSKATETSSVPQSQVWSQIEQSNVISQLVAKARGFQWEKNSEIVISLKPESLGRISLRASIVDQTVIATIVTESDKVKNLIELEMPVLHHALQENGMPVRVLVVQGSDLSFSNTSGNGQSHLHQNPSFQKSNGSSDLWTPSDRNDVGLNESPDVVDSRYRSRSIHLIA